MECPEAQVPLDSIVTKDGKLSGKIINVYYYPSQVSAKYFWFSFLIGLKKKSLTKSMAMYYVPEAMLIFSYKNHIWQSSCNWGYYLFKFTYSSLSSSNICLVYVGRQIVELKGNMVEGDDRIGGSSPQISTETPILTISFEQEYLYGRPGVQLRDCDTVVEWNI